MVLECLDPVLRAVVWGFTCEEALGVLKRYWES